MVVSVAVSIHDLSGNLIEKGEADIMENGSDWHYTIQRIPLTAGSGITAEAFDMPGNRALLSIEVD